MNELGKIILVILLSSVKFVAGPAFVYYDQRYEFSFFETIFYCVLGGMLGVFFFTYFSRKIISLWHYERGIDKYLEAIKYLKIAAIYDLPEKYRKYVALQITEAEKQLNSAMEQKNNSKSYKRSKK